MLVTVVSSSLLAVLLSANPVEVPEIAPPAKHGGWVGGVAFSPDGNLLATVGADEVLRIWALASRSNLLNFHLPGVYLSSVAFSPDGNSLAVGCWDKSVRVADVSAVKAGQRLQRVQKLVGHKGAVMAVAFTPDGKQLASAGLDGTIEFWDLAKGHVATLRRHKSWVNSLSFARDGRMASGSSDNSALVWRRKGESWEVESAHQVPEGEVRCVALSPSGRLLAAGTRYGTVRVWDQAGGKELAVLKGHPGDVWALAFSPDGNYLASGAGDWDRPGEVRLWDAATWRQVANLRHSGEVLCVAFSPDGRTLAAGAWDHTIKLWDVSKLTKPGR
jgi:WD40 repeat protein